MTSARARASRGGSALQQRTHQPALRGLVEVAHHHAPRPHLLEHPHGRHLRSEITVGPPERGVGARPEIHDQAVAGGRFDDRVEHLPPVRGDDPEAGEVDPAGETVRRDPVGRPDHPEQRRRDRERGRGAAPGSAVEGMQVEVLVEHAGVDRVGAGGGCLEEARVAAYVIGLGGSQPECPGGLLGIAGAETVSAVSTCSRGSVRSAKPRSGQSKGLATLRCRLAFRRGQQDQHRASLGRPLSAGA